MLNLNNSSFFFFFVTSSELGKKKKMMLGDVSDFESPCYVGASLKVLLNCASQDSLNQAEVISPNLSDENKLHFCSCSMFIAGWICFCSLLKTVTEQCLSGTAGFLAEGRTSIENHVPSLKTLASGDTHHFCLHVFRKSKFMASAEFHMVRKYKLPLGRNSGYSDPQYNPHTHKNPSSRNH